MPWSKVKADHNKPLGWWYHKIMCEIMYSLQGTGNGYYHHLIKMCDKYGFNLYGEKIPNGKT